MTTVTILGKPIDYDLNPLSDKDVLALFEKHRLDLNNYIQGFYAIQIFENDVSYIFTSKFGLYPFFYNKESRCICSHIEKISDVNDDFIREAEEYEDKQLRSTFKIKSYNSSVMGKTAKDFARNYIESIAAEPYFETIDNNFVLLKPNHEYMIDSTGKITFHETDNSLDAIESKNPLKRFITVIQKATEGKKKILVELNGSRESRLIASTLLYLNIDFDCLALGSDVDFVKTKIIPVIKKNLVTIDENEIKNKVDEIVYKHLTDTDGFSDAYYDAGYYYLAENIYPKYDLVISSFAMNEFYNMYSQPVLGKIQSTRINNGIGHLFKYLSEKTNISLPYCDSVFLFNITTMLSNGKDALLDKFISGVNSPIRGVAYETAKPIGVEIVPPFSITYDFNTRARLLRKLHQSLHIHNS